MIDAEQDIVENQASLSEEVVAQTEQPALVPEEQIPSTEEALVVSEGTEVITELGSREGVEILQVEPELVASEPIQEAIFAEVSTPETAQYEQIEVIDNEAEFIGIESAEGETFDPSSTYETELIISSLTMSDLDELKPLLIDDILIQAAGGKLEGFTQNDIVNQIQTKVQIIDEKQETLGIDYSIDELTIAIDYWINTILDRPVRGLGEVITPEIATADEKFLGISEEIAPTVVPSLQQAEQVIVAGEAQQIINSVDPVGQPTIDITEATVMPPTPAPVEVGDSLGVVQFFAIIIFCSIVLYVIRKVNDLKQGQGAKNTPSDFMNKLL